MAIITRIDTIAPGCTITMSYNDVSMKMTTIAANNQGTGTLTITMISPLSLVRTVSASNTLNYSIPTSSRPLFRISTASKNEAIKIDIPQILDIDWRASYGV